MNRIAQLRKEKHLNQTGLALKLNISQYMVSSYETERHPLTADMLIILSEFFGVSVDYLIGKTNIRYSAEEKKGDSLTEKELELLSHFRLLTKQNQERAIGVIIGLESF